MKTRIELFFAVMLITLSAFIVRAEVSLPNILGNSMVLQQKQDRHPNLTNDSNLLAAPFRTDDWSDPTAGKR